MSFKFKSYENQLLLIPLGGCNEIGANLNLYGYKGKWLMIDCGAGFAHDKLPGVDMIVPEVKFIEKYKKDLLGIILTHAHEDHIGAVQYLWNSLECPIYTTTFTANFLKLKLSEYEFAKKIQINEIKPGTKMTLGPFSFEMVPLTHSAPEMQAIMLRTEAGNVLHTGDWKFDPDPIIGNKNDETILKACGDEGVLALVCDSTNVFNEGVSGSEGELRKSLVDIIAGRKQLVVTTTFASNLARLDTLIHAGQAAGRKVALCGRSLHRIFEAAQASGYLKDIKPLIDEKSINKHPRSEVLVIATGCQGEIMAATSKMANNIHPHVKLAPHDTVIFSSKIIPGNETKIFSLFNAFVKLKIEVVTERDNFVHVSGHPAIDELKKMYSLIRPRICVPVHGEPVHINAHAKLARKSGINLTLEPENGDVLLLDPHQPKILGKVESGYLAVDGDYLLPSDSSVFTTRRWMSQAGAVVITIIYSKDGSLVVRPIISTAGMFDLEADHQLINIIKDRIIKAIGKEKKSSISMLPRDQIEVSIKNSVRKIMKEEINKSPLIIINVEKIT